VLLQIQNRNDLIAEEEPQLGVESSVPTISGIPSQVVGIQVQHHNNYYYYAGPVIMAVAVGW
jgi:hypothetical protein